VQLIAAPASRRVEGAPQRLPNRLLVHLVCGTDRPKTHPQPPQPPRLACNPLEPERLGVNTGNSSASSPTVRIGRNRVHQVCHHATRQTALCVGNIGLLCPCRPGVARCLHRCDKFEPSSARTAGGSPPAVSRIRCLGDDARQRSPLAGAFRARNDTRVSLARVRECLALPELDVEQPLPRAPSRRPIVRRLQLWKMCAASCTMKSANGSCSAK